MAIENKIDLSKVDVSMNGIELQDREFFAAIKEKRDSECQTSRSASPPCRFSTSSNVS